tara:strand:- start:11386 stop:11769 length:384 start_codon:yes stop_codon:yes gene_type:complete
MKLIRRTVRIAAPLLGVAATLAIAQSAPAPTCIVDYQLPDGACSKWVDQTDPDVCPDEVLNSQECKETAFGPVGSSQRGAYSSDCEMRVWSLDFVMNICRPTMVPPRTYRCYRAAGAPCQGGCQNGC